MWAGAGAEAIVPGLHADNKQKTINSENSRLLRRSGKRKAQYKQNEFMNWP